MRLHRGKVFHKERQRDQELSPKEHHHSRGSQEEEKDMIGEKRGRRTGRSKYISRFSHSTYLNHSFMDAKN